MDTAKEEVIIPWEEFQEITEDQLLMKKTINKYQKIILLVLFFCTTIFSSYSFAATFWVDGTNGNDSNDGSSKANAKKTISAGMALLDAGSPGDTLMIADGTYSGVTMTVYVSGDSSAYKTVQAETPGGVIIDRQNASWKHALDVTGDYVKIVGFLFKNGGEFVGQITSTSDHAYIKNCGFIGADSSQTYATVFSSNGTYALIEDSWFAGGGRYLIADGDGSYNLFRRVVGRWDYSRGNQPIGGFMNYHQNSAGGGSNTVYQNAIAINFNDPIGHDTWLLGAFADKYGDTIIRDSCIALDIISTDGGQYNQKIAAFFDEPAEEGTNPNTTKNCVAAGSTRGFYSVRSGPSSFTNVTAINNVNEGYRRNYGSITIKNSLFANNGVDVTDSSEISYSYNHFYNETARGTTSTTGNPLMKYLLRIESDSPAYQSGESGMNRGATILYRLGVDGTHYGDPDWDTLTNIPLWPFPNESRIRTDFRSVPDPPANNFPTTTNSSRGFAADGWTLTSYIWNYLGYPTFVRDTSAAPGNKKVTVNWSANAANENIDHYLLYYGTSSGIYGLPVNVGNVTSYTVTGLANGTIYYFAVTAVDGDGDEGIIFENEVSTIPISLEITSPSSDFFVNGFNCPTYTVSGSSDALSAVEIFAGSTSLGTTTTNGSGGWTKDVNFCLIPEGPVSLTAVSNSITSAPVTGTFDKTPPAAPESLSTQ